MRTRFGLLIAIGVSLLLGHQALGQNADVFGDEAQYLHNVQRVDAAVNRFELMKPSLLRLDSQGQNRLLAASRFSAIANVFLLTEQIAQDWDMTANGGAGDWLNTSRIAWTRNSAGFATEQLIESWDAVGGVWSPEGRTTFDLNSQNRSEETLTEGWNPDANGGQGAYEPVQRVTSTYDGDGNSLTRTTEIWDEDSGTWFLWNRSTSSYQNGNLVQQVFESLNFFTGMFGPSLRTNFEYDGAGRTISRIRETYDDATSTWENSSRRLWTFDGNGIETEDLEQSWDGGAWVNDYREVTTYEGTPSNPTSETVTAQDWDGSDWVNRDRGVFTASSSTEWLLLEQDWDPIANDWVNREQQITTLNSNGDFTEFVTQLWDVGQGAWVNEDRSSVVYNNEGLITEFLGQIWDGSQWVNDTRLIQSYGEFTGTAVEETPEGRFTLEANYPNPFRDETTIRYSLPSTQNVTVEVFDLLGRRVTTLVDGPSAPGTHSLRIDGTELAGGLYVYRLKSSAVILSRTMMLVK